MTKARVWSPFTVNGRMDIAERPHLAHDRVRPRVGHAQDGRTQTGEVHTRAVRAVDGVVRPRAGDDGGDAVAGGPVHDAPYRSLEGGDVQQPAVRSDGHPVAAHLVFAVPEHLLGDEIDRGQALRRREIEPAGGRAGRDALDVLRGQPFRHGEGRDPLHEPVPRVLVEDEDAHPAVLDVVAHARRRDVEEVPLLASGGGHGGGPRSAAHGEPRRRTGNHGYRSDTSHRQAHRAPPPEEHNPSREIDKPGGPH